MWHIVKLSWRSIWRNRRRTIITLSSIGFGLALGLFFIAMGEGMYAKLTDDAVRMEGGHVTIEHADYRDAPAVDLVVPRSAELGARLAALPGVERVKTFVLGQGVAKTGTDAVGVAIVGVDPAAEVATSPLARKMVAGTYLGDSEDVRKVIVGQDLAERLGLAVGKKVIVATNDAEGNLVEELLRVQGIFRTGSDEADGYLLQVPIAFARKLYRLGPDDATQVGLVLDDPGRRGAVLSAAREALRSAAGGARLAALPWEEVLPDLAGYIRTDRMGNVFMQVVIIALIMFTIFNTILMSVLERKREFAVLLALGTPPRRLRLQILCETALIALLGVGLGLLVGGLSSHAACVYGIDLSAFWDSDVSIAGFAVDTIVRPLVTLELLAGIGGLVFAATMLLGLIPMRRAARVLVADVLR